MENQNERPVPQPCYPPQTVLIPPVYYPPPSAPQPQMNEERRPFSCIAGFCAVLFCVISFLFGIFYALSQNNEEALEDLQSETMGIDSKLGTINETAENTENALYDLQKELRSKSQKSKEELKQIKKEIEMIRVYDVQKQDQSILTESKKAVGRNASEIKQNSSQISELKNKLHNLELKQHRKKYNEQSKAPSQ